MTTGNNESNRLVAGRVWSTQLAIQIPFSISRETLTQAEAVFVEMTSECGQQGVGEASPFPSLTYDTVDDAKKTISQFLPTIQNVSTSEALAVLMSHRQDIRRESITAYTAMETAVWDLHAKIVGKPLSQIWGTGARTSIDTDITLPIMPVNKIPQFWQLFGKHAFPIVKVKISGHREADVPMILELVKILPMDVKISLDGNQGYTYADAVKLVAQLHENKIVPVFFEQPLAADDWGGLQKLTAALPIPVCLDETIQSIDDAKKMINEKSGNMINLKIMKSGIDQTREIMEVAHRHRVPLMIGGMLETEVAMGTSLQLACASNKIAFADLDTPFFMKERISLESPWHSGHAHLQCPFRNGHGIMLKSDYLN